jgi:hypothetical protein
MFEGIFVLFFVSPEVRFAFLASALRNGIIALSVPAKDAMSLRKSAFSKASEMHATLVQKV